MNLLRQRSRYYRDGILLRVRRDDGLDAARGIWNALWMSAVMWVFCFLLVYAWLGG